MDVQTDDRRGWRSAEE